MFARTRITRSWKHHRWKNINELYSTLRQFPHAYIPYVIARNIDIDYLAKSGQLEVARSLFDEMPTRTVVTWNTMISGYAKWGSYTEALNLVSSMHCSSTKLNETTFSTVLSLCSHSQSLTSGRQIHCLLLKSGTERFDLVGSGLLYFYASCFNIHDAWCVFDGLHESNPLVWSLMVVGCVKCNLMDDALDVFMKMPSRDVVSWTTLISGYSKSAKGCEKALQLFKMMRENDDVRPNEFTLDCVLRACGTLRILREGKCVHGLVFKFGFEFDESIGGALIDMYCNCEVVDDGKRAYDALTFPCLNASNSLIGGYILLGRIEDAELVFNGMLERNPVSYNLMIKGYATIGRVDDSKKLFATMPQKTITSTNTMISVYSRNGEIHNALKLFEDTRDKRSPVTWNSMISAYIQNEQHEEAIKLYVIMCRLLIDRTRSTFSALFHACSCLGSLLHGKSLHGHLIKTPFESNLYVGTSLVDMYARCGSISDAEKSFSCISFPNMAAWTALINGYAHHGLGSEAVVLFKWMLKQGINPNAATFVGILSACGHAGLIVEGMSIFHSMEICCATAPSLEHYACVVDLLGRSGHLNEAEKLITTMPIEADDVVWGALLSACWFWMDTEMAERVAQKIFALDCKSVSAYVIISNMYAKLGRWGEKMRLRKILRGLQVKKNPGCSWIEVNNSVHAFAAEDQTHPSSNLVYETLRNLVASIYPSVEFGEVHGLLEYGARTL